MFRAKKNLLGVGIYTVPEASRLTGIPSRSIRRWLVGYTFRHHKKETRMPPVWRGDLPRVDDKAALSFLDMMEARVINVFRKLGVRWPMLRNVATVASEKFGTSHPFCTERFRTNGRRIFIDVLDSASGEKSLQDVVTDQTAFKRILDPFLSGAVEFSPDDVAIRWWPLGQRRQVVIDPHRSFGQPIVATEGVPTTVLHAAHKANRSWDAVASWYGVTPRAVRDAVRFEREIAAA
ncbi:MAG: hypothetical protein E3J64_06505 [Anaerolineales bacterium]|nr:MAG: hypothetical protein E3J64_06505 [Anaerolineales bacterium]